MISKLELLFPIFWYILQKKKKKCQGLTADKFRILDPQLYFM